MVAPIADDHVNDEHLMMGSHKDQVAPKEALTSSLAMENLLSFLEMASSMDRYVVLGKSIMFVFSYILHFISNLELCEFHDAITALDDIAKCVIDVLTRMKEENEDERMSAKIETKKKEFFEMLGSFFRPEVVGRFFIVPKLHQLPQSDKHLYPNEIIAGFLDFLLQVLFHETNISEDHVQRWALVRKELSFLLAILGDIPFQCTHHDLEVVANINILLGELEMLANDAGSFVYDAVFPSHQMKANMFNAETTAWFAKAEFLKTKIEEHCFKFSELPMSVISRSSVVDSFFIVHSLIEDIENLKNHTLNFNHGDDTMEQVITLHGELTLSQSFIKVLKDDEEKEGLIQIRDLTYEAEYLINSFLVGNIDVWYLNLRLPSIIDKIKLARSELQVQTSQTMLITATGGKVSFPTTGDTASINQSDHLKKSELSYKHLPRNIKPCFLYFAGFPKDSEITQEKLTWFWITEGFIQKEGNKSLEETAEMYLLDLINRKLLIAERGFGYGRRCRIDSQLHEFCVEKAKQENFMKFTNGFSVYERCQRLCVPSTSWSSCPRPFGLHCRSYRDIRTRKFSSCSFQTMALLKVVDLMPEYNSCPKLAFPAQLRYLGVVGDLSNELVANLVNLEFMHVRSGGKVRVPSVVLRMVKLRNLLVEEEAEFEKDWHSNMRETTSLRTLSFVRINGKKDEDILRWCPHLLELKCIFTDKTRSTVLSFLSELESLKLTFESSRLTTAEKLFSTIKFPSTIKKLSLVKCNLPWEMMSILGRLPNLNVLKLGFDFFGGKVWETRDGEFQKLKCLKIDNNYDLKLWISCSQHFPTLECLMLRHCQYLVEIPSDFANIRTLQKIDVYNCTAYACFSALALQIGKQVQLDMSHSNKTKDELLLNLTNPSFYDLTDMLSCMEEYSQAGGSEGFVNKLPIDDYQTEDDETTDEDADAESSEGSMDLSLAEDKPKDQTEDETTTTTIDDDDDEALIIMKKQAYLMVVSYAMQFSSTLENQALGDTIMGLRCIAASYISKKQLLPEHPCYVEEIKKSRKNFSERLVNSFIPQVQRLFEVPKIEQLPHEHKKNEILASFIDFLLQMMCCKVNSDLAENEQYVLLQKELSFLLAILGDIPFQPTDYPEYDNQVNNLLTEFEMFANEAGGFLFSCVFPIQPMKINRFHVETNALLEMAKLLNAKIKEHCTNFMELHVSVIVRSTSVDSSFILDSIVEDLHNIIKNCQLGNLSPDDAIMEQITTLQGELTLSQSLIKAMRDNDSNEKREGLIQIRDLTYKAEYLVNSLVAGNIHVWYVNLRLPSIVSKIKLARIGLQQTSESKAIKASDGDASFPTTGIVPTIDDSQFIDFNQEITETMLNDLTGISNTLRKFITIFGMPGLGKTSTASKLYNGRAAFNHFDRRAWCVVSEKYNVRALFIQILHDLANEPDKNRERKEKANSELGEEIHKSLKGRRYLIVLDDVWHSEVLDKLRRYFPDDRNGSRVVITTRNKDVSPSGSTLYELPILSKHQCWNLLEKKIFPKDPCPSHLVSVGKRIASRCSGVPLAVVSIAGILLNVEKEKSEWERVEEGLDTMLLDDQSDYRKIMELSYEHLPHNLKPCFLYFARYPEDAEISTKELTRYWTAERFIQKDGKKSPEEIAESYLLDLINRSLVLTAERTSVGRTKTCRIHDLLHDICIKKADEQSFMRSTNLFSTYEKHQHLCLHASSKNINWRPFGLHCRSFSGCYTEQLSGGFRTMALIKVADLLPKEKHHCRNSAEVGPLEVDLPCQLRYLGISGDLIPERLVDNLVNLEVLHVRSVGFQQDVLVPPVILRMAKLRHLLVRRAAVFEEDCSISETTNLRSISRVVIGMKSDELILRNSPHLQTLKCISGGKMIFPDLSSLVELQSLRIDYHYDYDFKGKRLLSEASFPSSIKKLCLSDSRFPWEKMSIIGTLPKLQVLKLELNAFVGKKWETKDDQFQELRYLKIDGLDLKQWNTESSHFPSLEQLVLSSCWSLGEIPSDLGYISTLQRIEMRDCSKDAYLSAIEVEQEQRELGNQQLQVDIIDREWTKEELMQEGTEED